VIDHGFWHGEEALMAMSKLGPEALPTLKDVLTTNEDPSKRWIAAQSLGQIGDPDALNVLEEALREDVDEVRYHVAIALGRIGDERAIPSLTKALQDKKRGVRQEARKSLIALGVPEDEIPDISRDPEPKRQTKGHKIHLDRFRDFRTGKIRLPAKQSLKKAMLEDFFQENFEKKRVYQEKEVNDIIHRQFADHCTIRRYFVDHGMMSRERGRYWVI
jgi:HEAT repeat protein